MKRCLLLTIIILFFLAPFPAAAEEKPWSGEGEVGFLMTTGNSETESLNAGLRIGYEAGRWRHTGRFQALYSAEEIETETGDEEMETSAERYRASAKTDYKFTENNYAFLTGSYEDDRFSGYDYQATVAAGYGRRLLQTERLLMEVEAGPGYRYNRLQAGGKEESAILRAFALFTAKLTETSTFKQELSVETGSDQTVTESLTSLQAGIIGALSMKAAFTLEHTSTVPEGTEKTETETALTLVYSF
jgi:putative salt-induced outer membrane protein YdiY